MMISILTRRICGGNSGAMCTLGVRGAGCGMRQWCTPMVHRHLGSVSSISTASKRDHHIHHRRRMFHTSALQRFDVSASAAAAAAATGAGKGDGDVEAGEEGEEEKPKGTVRHVSPEDGIDGEMTPERHARLQWIQQQLDEAENHGGSKFAEKMPRHLFRSPMVDIDQLGQDGPLISNAYVSQPKQHEGTLIWLHDISDTQERVRPIFEMMGGNHTTRIVVPWASKIPITALDEQDERAWFDWADTVVNEETAEEEDVIGIEDARQDILQLLRAECELIPSKKIVIGGFGQGGVMAIHTGLNYELPLAGIISFSGYVSQIERYPKWIHEAQRDTPLLAYHGNADAAIEAEFAKARYQDLKRHVPQLELRMEFHMEHFMSTQPMLEMQYWWQNAMKSRK